MLYWIETTSSKSSGETGIPDNRSRSMNSSEGAAPWNRPRTRPSSATPVWSKIKMSLNAQVIQACDFGDVSYLSCAVAEARGLYQQVNDRGHLLANESAGQVEFRHHDHRLQPAEGIGGRIGVDGCHRAFDAGPHCLQHVFDRDNAFVLRDETRKAIQFLPCSCLLFG